MVRLANLSFLSQSVLATSTLALALPPPQLHLSNNIRLEIKNDKVLADAVKSLLDDLVTDNVDSFYHKHTRNVVMFMISTLVIQQLILKFYLLVRLC